MSLHRWPGVNILPGVPDQWNETFREVYRDLAGPMTAFVTARVQGRPDLNAEDVCQEIWMRFHAKGRAAAKEGHAGPWLFATARNLIIDLKMKIRLKTTDDLESIQGDALWRFDSSDPAHQMAEREQQTREDRSLGTCLERLERAKPAHAALIRLMLSGTVLSDISRQLRLDRERCHKIKFEAVKALRDCVAGREP